MSALDDLEARVSALEAANADYRAVLSAVNALGANQRDHSLCLNDMEVRLTSVETRVRAGFRSVDEQLAEIKDLIVRGRG